MSEVFRTPDDRFDDLESYPYKPNYLDLAGGFAGLRMHYLDEGSGDPILLLHGEPTWAYLYRKMMPALTGSGRVIAPDFIGFGRSDKPVDIRWYTYDHHFAALMGLIEALDLTSITVVVQDWGGPIGLRAAVEHGERFARLVILNTGIYRPGPNWPSPAFLQWREFAEKNPDLPVGFIIQGATKTDLSERTVAGYEAPFPSAESKAGVAAFPLIVPLTEDDPGAAEMRRVGDALTRWDKPALVAFSDSDPIFPQRAGEKLAERIPGAGGFVSIQGASHFLQEDKGEVVADKIVDFLSTT